MLLKVMQSSSTLTLFQSLGDDVSTTGGLEVPGLAAGHGL